MTDQFPAEIAKQFAKLMRLKPAPKALPLRPHPDGTVILPFLKPAGTFNVNGIRTGLSGHEYAGATVEDFEFKATRVKGAMGADAIHLSVFLALDLNAEIYTYQLAYSTDIHCLTITPLPA